LDCLVILTAVESSDSEKELKEMVSEVKKIAKSVDSKSIVLYPYAHLSSNLSDPDTAQDLLKKAESILKKDFKVTRAPFGYYKTFEFKCKGHPLSELSREFGDKEEKGKTKTKKVETEEKPERLLRQIARVKLDTSKLKDNDHRILGQNLDLFSFSEAAPGSVFWHSKGLVIYNKLIEFWREIHKAADYQEVSTPQILDNKLWKVSGHWQHYELSRRYVNL
jgi:threonyl-tRNA synthetase